jgi:peptidyl-dipeptidase A
MTRTIRLFFLTALLLFNCSGGKMEQEFQTFLDLKMVQLQPLEKQRNLAYWNAAISGKKEDFDLYSQLDFAYENLFTNAAEFESLKKFKESGEIKSELLARQLEVFYKKYLGNQIDSTLLRRITALEGQVENKFSVFRAKIDGAPVTNNQILIVLKNETQSASRQKAWEASKMVGAEVATDLLALVKLRNQAAKNLGFENYYAMSLALSEQDERVLLGIFDGLAELTEAPFKKLKTELDVILAKRTGTTPETLRPWHYHDPFFQEAPMIFEIDLDQYYANHDVKQLTEAFYQGIGLPVDSIFAKSDIYEKEGKNPHAFCTHLDRSGDVRVLMNLKSDVSWMETSLHEMGHGVYDRYLDFNLPFILREPAHAFTTEAIAMFFGRLARNPYWMQTMLGLSDPETNEIAATVKQSLRLQQLIFSRWCQVMLRFERALYTDPEQDLNKLWWDLVEKYQFVTRPENRNQPDWAAKIHFTIAPVYYHNYLLGELMASQLHEYLVKNVLKLPTDHGVSYVGSLETGAFLRQNIFQPGNKWMWNDLLRHATGEPLNPEYFVTQFVK